MTAELGRGTVRLSEVLSWKPGDILPLDRHVDEPIDLLVEKGVKFRCRPRIFRQNRAVRIDERVFPDLTGVKREEEEE